MRRLGAGAGAALIVLVLCGTASAASLSFRLGSRQQAGVVQVHLAPGAGHVKWRAYLNGHDVTPTFGYVAPRGRWITVSPTDGLRFGRNRLVIKARYPSGTRRFARAFTVSQSLPLAAAGPDVRLLGKGAVTLSAHASKAAKGGTLVYHWVIARRPGGSRHARMVRADSARPRLLTDVAGTYVVHLIVRERHGATMSAPRLDSVQVEQTPPAGKQGVFVAAEALTSTSGRLHIAGGGPLAGSYQVGSGGKGADVALFFDRATTELLPRTHPSPYYVSSDAAGAKTLSEALKTAEAEAGKSGHTVGLLLVATNAGGYSTSFGQFLSSTAKVTGVPKVGSRSPFALYTTAGVEGASWIAAGEGRQREFAGLLAPDSNDNFSFAPSDVPSLAEENVTFATSPAGITVNGNTMPSGRNKPCAEAHGGYEVRILDANTLTDVADASNGATFWTNYCGQGNERDNPGTVEADRMSEFIQRSALAPGLGPRLVIIQGVGVPQHADPSGNLQGALLAVARQVRALGGSAEAFAENPDALERPSYALVGKNFQTNGAVGSSDSSTAEVTSAAPTPEKQEAALSGVLSRDRQWRYTVAANAVGTALTGASGAAYLQLRTAAETINPTTLAPTQFPEPAHWLEMSNYTAEQYGYTESSIEDLKNSLCAPMPESGHKIEIDIRYLYCGGGNSQGSWQSKAADLLANVRAGSRQPPPGVQRKAHESFLEQLETEGALVDNINRVTSVLTRPFGVQGVEAKVNLEAAVETVDAAVAKARNEKQKEFEMQAKTFGLGDKLFLFGDLFDIGEVIAEVFSEGALPTVLGFASGISDVAAQFADEKNGTPVLGPFVPGTLVSTLRTELAENMLTFDEALQRTRDLIVSDWGRLQASKGISIAAGEGAKLERALRVSGDQFIWRSLMQSLFTPTRVVATDYNPASATTFDARNYRCPVWGDSEFESTALGVYFWRPWGKQATFGGRDRGVFRDRNNLAPLEGTYIAAGGQEAYVLSAGGKGYPFKSYTSPTDLPPYNTSTVEPLLKEPPQNLPPGTFAPLFEVANKTTATGATEGENASPQGISKQQLFPQIIRAAEQAGKLNTLDCEEVSSEFYENGVEGTEETAEELNTVEAGKPATATAAKP
jgi:hypothetical protein